MVSEKLINAVQHKTEPNFSNDTERCLWLAGMGMWDQSHDIVESLPEPGASWIHAMLHREEGDLGNADYWYQRAQKQMPEKGMTVKEEWLAITEALLD